MNDLEIFIEYHPGSQVTVGLLGSEPFLEGTLSVAPTVNFIGISTGFDATGEWTFCGFSLGKFMSLSRCVHTYIVASCVGLSSEFTAAVPAVLME